MEPRLIGRGKGQRNIPARRVHGSLQWSRDLLVAERLANSLFLRPHSTLQWSRDLLVAERLQ